MDWRAKVTERRESLLRAASEATAEAAAAADALGNTARQAEAAAAAAACDALRHMLDQEQKNQHREATEEEQKAVLRALLAAEPNLAGPGWSQVGHFHRCPNGHIYIIGDCGGAMETGRCIQCGAAIGGTSYRLAEGNAPATGLGRL